jgi:hypothetical protein
MTMRALGTAYGIDKSAAARHMRLHVKALLNQNSQEVVESMATTVTALVRKALTLIDAQLTQALVTGEPATAAINSLRGYLATLIDLVKAEGEGKRVDTGDTAWKRYLDTHTEARAAYLLWYRAQTRPLVNMPMVGRIVGDNGAPMLPPGNGAG